MTAVAQSIKEFILKEFLPGEKPGALTETTPLITGGILDSLGTVQLVLFLEETYGIELKPSETGVDHLNTVADIARLVESRRA
jgi:acyl carrier protein